MHQGYAVYRRARNNQPSRVIEGDLFRIVLGSLRRAKKTGKLRHCLDAKIKVERLWHALLADLVSTGNRLPHELKKSLAVIGLSQLREVDTRSVQQIDFDFLIGVNEEVLAGLRPPSPQALLPGPGLGPELGSGAASGQGPRIAICA